MGKINYREDQLPIIKYEGGKMAVPAVPGAGKTFIVTNLVAKLLEEKRQGKGKILILTYMNSAVNNFKVRIKKILEEKNRNQKKIEWLKKELHKKREINYEKIIEESILKEKLDRLLLTSIIDKITISENKRIEIYYKIKNETFESISCDPFLK